MKPRFLNTIAAACLLAAACSSARTPTAAPVHSPAATPAPTSAGSVAPGPVSSGAGAVSPSPESSITDTTGWRTEQIPSLGYRIDVPPDFERVSDDPSQPVPSFAAIAKANPDQAQNLQIVATRLEENTGVFADLGLWAVQPSTLNQVGVLAGVPYRIADADLEQKVQQSTANRASPLEATEIDEIDVPAGHGYLAKYRDLQDLSDHEEAHIRTPNGRYLVVAMSVDGTIEPKTSNEFLAIVGSLSPSGVPGAGDTPAPSVGPEGHSDAQLEAMLPESVGNVTLTKRSLNGEDVVGSSVQTGGTVIDALGTLVPAPGLVNVALAVPTSGSSNLLVAVYALDGVSGTQISDLLATFPSQIWSHQTIGGRDTLVSVAGSDKARTYLRLSGDTLEQVQTDDAALAAQALGALP